MGGRGFGLICNEDIESRSVLQLCPALHREGGTIVHGERLSSLGTEVRIRGSLQSIPELPLHRAPLIRLGREADQG